MVILDARTVAARLPYDRLVPALRDALAQEWQTPRRVHFDLGGGSSTLMMPAWNARHLGVKLVNVFPGNARHGQPTVSSHYLLSDGRTGELEAFIDGETLTARRTASVAALAASFLAPVAADHVLVVGAGRVARELPAALSAVRPIRRVTVWARQAVRAAALVREIEAQGTAASVCTDLAEAAATASIIACATFATEPIIRGEWLGRDTHLSLIGGFRPSMREADSEAIRRSYVAADTRDGVLAEAGDILTPIAEGTIEAEHVRTDLFQLCRATGPLVTPRGMPTLFKSVGHAIQDLAAARLCMVAEAPAP